MDKCQEENDKKSKFFGTIFAIKLLTYNKLKSDALMASP